MPLEQLTGSVVKETVAKGSKSEHAAVLIVAGGKRFILRREGGNAFRDPALDALVGKTIQCSGRLAGTTFLMTKWSDVPPG